METFTYKSGLAVPAATVFRWHMQDGAISRLIPGRDNVTVESFEGISEGSRAVLKMHLGPVSKQWVAVHTNMVPDRSFTDIQESGPLKYWKHEHLMVPASDSSTEMVDNIRFQLPCKPFSDVLKPLAYSKLKTLFRYRHRVLRQDLTLHGKYGSRKLTYAVTGSSGLIGSELVPFLRAGGHAVKTLVRRRPEHDREIYWNPKTGEIDARGLEDVDIVIHLAGASLFTLWSESNKKRFYDSRIDGTRLIAQTISDLPNKPSAFISSSAIGIYGDRDDEILNESSKIDSDSFLAGLCRDWEAAAGPARDAGIRTVHPRIGVVVSGGGGALKPVVAQFKLGLGGLPGNQNSYLSWVSMDDVLGALYHLSTDPLCSGPVNITAPEPVTWLTLAESLGRIMHRPSFWRIPGSLVEKAGGEFAREIILGSTRAIPEYLVESEYEFLVPSLEEALGHQLGYDYDAVSH